MPSSGYTSFTFTAGEVPTTAKWSLVPSNDASFNNGNGFNDGILAWRHFAANSFSPGVTSFVNAGSAGGTFYYINLGGLKLLWGLTGSINLGGTSGFQVSTALAVTLPVGFFTTIQKIDITVDVVANTSFLFPVLQSKSTSSLSVALGQMNGSNGTASLNIGLIGA